MELVHAFEGSTALQSVLMSSPHLSTLCSYNSWQCEGQWILEDAVSNKTNGIVGQNWRTRNLLPTFSEVWDLDREVLFDKSPHFLLDNVESIHKHLVAALPDKMLQAGIRRLDAAYIMMWRPTCLGFLAGHSEKWSTKQFAMRMLAVLRQLVEVHKLVRTMGLPILVICQGDLLWDAGATLRRIESFCLACILSPTTSCPHWAKTCFQETSGRLTAASRHTAKASSQSPSAMMCAHATARATWLSAASWAPGSCPSLRRPLST